MSLERYLDFYRIRMIPRAGVPAAAVDELPEHQPSPLAKNNAALQVIAQEYDAIEAQAKSCTACRLCETRTNVVFGVGNRHRPPIAFVGEGPGADEDRLGEPFVGRAGALLTAAITNGLKMRREDVYICNVVKCRPPGNRTPAPDEIASCFHYLVSQLKLVQPQVIVTLGAPAQMTLVGQKGGITKIRGRWLQWEGIPVMPTLHPAYILRNPEAKRPFWEDLQEVMRRLSTEGSLRHEVSVS